MMPLQMIDARESALADVAAKMLLGRLLHESRIAGSGMGKPFFTARYAPTTRLKVSALSKPGLLMAEGEWRKRERDVFFLPVTALVFYLEARIFQVNGAARNRVHV